MHYSIYEGENYQAMAAIRSALYVPADSERRIDSAARLSVDSIILDLEDGVAPSAKLAAPAPAPTASNARLKVCRPPSALTTLLIAPVT